MKITALYFIRLFSVVFLTNLLLVGCTADKLPLDSSPLDIRLKVHYHPTLLPDQQAVTIGIQWVLSYLGAALTPQQWQAATQWEGKQFLKIDLAKVGFSTEAEQALQSIVQTIHSNPAYQKKNSIDIGRFVMLTFGSSYHYYQITGIATDYSQFINLHPLNPIPLVTLQPQQSSVTPDTRTIFIADNFRSLSQIAFVAQEGQGSQLTSEVFDYMPNGQPRFAIYDALGQLKSSANSFTNIAGKPAKCMWCHESGIQPNFATQTTPTLDTFNFTINQKQHFLDSIRQDLNTVVDFDQKQAHQLAELLYITFMQPTLERLMAETGQDSSTLTNLLQFSPTYTSTEHPTLGTSYDRIDVDALLLPTTLPIPESAREQSAYEPRF